jgi:hypothetical protein
MATPRWLMKEWQVWSGENSETFVVVCDPSALLIAKPLARALTPGSYELLALEDEQHRARALLLRRRKAAAAVAVESGEDIAIDTAGIALVSSREHAKLLAARDPERAIRSVAEAPRGELLLPLDGDDVFMFATLVAGDGRAQTHWLLDKKKRIVALHIALPPLDANADDTATILAGLPPAK